MHTANTLLAESVLVKRISRSLLEDRTNGINFRAIDETGVRNRLESVGAGNTDVRFVRNLIRFHRRTMHSAAARKGGGT